MAILNLTKLFYQFVFRGEPDCLIYHVSVKILTILSHVKMFMQKLDSPLPFSHTPLTHFTCALRPDKSNCVPHPPPLTLSPSPYSQNKCFRSYQSLCV